MKKIITSEPTKWSPMIYVCLGQTKVKCRNLLNEMKILLQWSHILSIVWLGLRRRKLLLALLFVQHSLKLSASSYQYSHYYSIQRLPFLDGLEDIQYSNERLFLFYEFWLKVMQPSPTC